MARELENLQVTLKAYANVRGSRHGDLRHARVELASAQAAYDNAEADYQRIVYCLLNELAKQAVEVFNHVPTGEQVSK